MKERVIVLFFIALFLISFVSSAQTVVVQQDQPQEEKKGWFSTYFGFLKSPIFWWIIFGLLVVLGVFILVFFLVRWLIKFFKSQSDIFYKLKKDRMKLASIHRRFNSKHWYKVYKNTPIRLVKNVNGKVLVTTPIAYHRGDYTTHEGNVILSLNLRGNKKFFFFPITDILIIPDRESIEIVSHDEKGKPKTIIVDHLPRAKDIVQFNEDEILIHAESLSNVGMFYVPVLYSVSGKIIDLALPVYQTIRDVVTQEFLYEQTNEFSKVAKKSIDLNPNLRYQMKSNDATSSVDVPDTNKP